MTWATAIGGSILLLVLYYMATANRAVTDSRQANSNEDYKKAVFDDLSRGPNG